MALKSEWYLRDRLKLRHLKFLITMDEVGKQSEAASVMATTQPGASKMMAELETMVGAPLFERTARGSFPTPHGRILIRYARRILGELDRVGEELSAVTEEISGQVHLGTNSSSAAYLVPHSIMRLYSHAPAVTVVVREGTIESLTPELNTRKLDLVVGRLGKATLQTDYEHVVLLDEPMALVAAAAHPLSHDQHLDWKDLQRYPWVLPPQGSPVSGSIELLMERHGLFPRCIARSASIVHNMVLIESAQAIGVLPAIVARQYVQRGAVAILPLKLPAFGPLAVFQLRGMDHSPAVKLVLQSLRETALSYRTQHSDADPGT